MNFGQHEMACDLNLICNFRRNAGGNEWKKSVLYSDILFFCYCSLCLVNGKWQHSEHLRTAKNSFPHTRREIKAKIEFSRNLPDSLKGWKHLVWNVINWYSLVRPRSLRRVFHVDACYHQSRRLRRSKRRYIGDGHRILLRLTRFLLRW